MHTSRACRQAWVHRRARMALGSVEWECQSCLEACGFLARSPELPCRASTTPLRVRVALASPDYSTHVDRLLITSTPLTSVHPSRSTCPAPRQPEETAAALVCASGLSGEHPVGTRPTAPRHQLLGAHPPAPTRLPAMGGTAPETSAGGGGAAVASSSSSAAAAMAASGSCNHSLGALYFINGRGDVLLQRIYRDDLE